MKIVISPAKKMNVDLEYEAASLPCFLDRAEELMKYLQGFGFHELKELWKCNDRIALTNYERLKNMDLTKGLTPALIAYEGIQYQYMAPKVFETGHWEYVNRHLYILSGFYGLLRPLDGVVPYRLEMQAEVKLSGLKGLYEYWGDRICRKVYEDTDTVLNLASREYGRCLEEHLEKGRRLVTCVFGEYRKGRIVTKGTYAKMARGEMVRFMAENGIEELDGLKEFDRLGYRYRPEESEEGQLVFIKE
ncbi:hypothetical protein HNQ56_000921 [Anaerotaenia torta]|uniref:peroxide stress protein YaaA n=1 Tax=Anaerotaenia torta TaxID=433293 RepID=UPI003D243DCA